MLKAPLNRLAPPLLALPRSAKRAIVISVDVALCLATTWFAYFLRLGEFIQFVQHPQWGTGAVWAALAAVLLSIPIFVGFGLYRAIFRHSDWPALLTVARAVSVYGLAYACIFTVLGVPGVPRTVGIIQPLLLLIGVGATRALAHAWLGDKYQHILQYASRPKALIYGAGRAGRQLAAAMSNSLDMHIVGFLDDDDRLHGHVLNDLPIYAPDDLPGLVASLGIGNVLLAIPSLSRSRRNAIIDLIGHAPVAVRTLPSVSDLAQGRVDAADVHDLDIDDLLGREAVAPHHLLLGKNTTGKVVLVTGAGGSIGSELCRQILRLCPSKLLLLDVSEFALYNIFHDLEAKCDSSVTTLVPLLASVQDIERLREIMSTWGAQTVYHAAAYKHVPLVEHNPIEGVKNNVFGTVLAARAAAQSGVSDFVLISTDKAVRPTNVMGASKRLAEMVLQAFAATRPATRFSMVRFGNVLGSSGSVVPRFRQQIRAGGPVTVTHPDITRYFMTIAEAAQLVVQAGAMAKGGDVFVLDMGEPVKIVDLARRMVKLSGLTVKDAQHPDGNIEIAYSGLRPGEKLYEELLIGDDPQRTAHPRIMKAHEEFIPWPVLEEQLAQLLDQLQSGEVAQVRASLERLVNGYRPQEDIVDWVYLEQGVA